MQEIANKGAFAGFGTGIDVILVKAMAGTRRGESLSVDIFLSEMKSEKGVDINRQASSASFFGMNEKEESLMEHIKVDLIAPAFQIRVSQEILSRKPLLIAKRAGFKGAQQMFASLPLLAFH